MRSISKFLGFVLLTSISVWGLGKVRLLNVSTKTASILYSICPILVKTKLATFIKNPGGTMEKRRTIGTNPIEDYLLSSASEPSEEVQKEVEETKKRITLYLSSELVEKIKNIVYWEPALTLGRFAEEALEAKVEELESAHGSPYADRATKNLRPGRPLS